jgi:hypothetical protein
LASIIISAYGTELYQKGVIAMKSRALSTTAMILLTPLVVLAFRAQAEQVRKGELNSKSFTTGSLKITITSLNMGRINANGYIGIEVENTSGDFTTFAPQRLTLIDKNDNQIDIVGQFVGMDRNNGALVVAVGDKRIWPKARITHTYKMTKDTVKLPARLYYEDKLLATIIE